ncbi:glutaredoxin domain-containing protein [Peribacillus loiseleuriae]|uniref:Glutaredoxin n=1 Tax=Peribacillus loiseleuriae TaxID=1679170 RepID=A0A0K9GRG1_9BACI|nr:glutaredoxin domain-containing protein [Peribacillus loiseleuriae]KMY49284.1 glutaredoxin [Peribacillus loiseleuriae]
MNKVTLFTQPDCPPCTIVKMFFNEYNISFQEKDIKADASAMRELTKKYGSYSTPTVIINGEAIIGFEIEKMKIALSIND